MITTHPLRRVVLVGNQKGGVWKSSIVAALGAMIAKKDRRVLVIDADPQGNVSKADLGTEGDRGRNLAMALQYANPLEPVRDVRPGLDLIPGGQFLSAISTLANSDHGLDIAANFRQTLGDLCSSEQYALVLIDSGPGDAALLDALLATAQRLIVPSASDEASLDGVALLAKRYMHARAKGATVSLLGVVLVAVNPRATARNRAVLKEITAMLDGSGAEAFGSTIRTDQAAAIDIRSRHITPAELVDVNKSAKSSRLKSLAEGGRGRTSDTIWSRDASGLAGDYHGLAREVLTRIAAQERAESEAAAS